MESTPLLEGSALPNNSIDPPIDDESFRNESHPFPSEEQKQLTFVGYQATSIEARFSEILSVFLIAIYYDKSLVPITFFSFCILATSTNLEVIFRLMSSLFTSRLKFICFLIFQQKLAMICFALTWIKLQHLETSRLLYQSVGFIILTLSIVWVKCAFTFYQSSFRSDWLQVLTCSHQNLRVQFERIMSVSSIFSQFMLSIFIAFMVQWLPSDKCCRVLIFLAVCGLFIELTMIYKLHSSCYALHLPREHDLHLSKTDIFEYSPMIGVLTTHFTVFSAPNRSLFITRASLSLMYEYIKSKPIPVAVTIGSTFVNVSLVTLGPHVAWFAFRKDVSAPTIALYKLVQGLFSIRPICISQKAFLLCSFGNIAAVLSLVLVQHYQLQSKWYVHLFLAATILSKSGVAGINRISDQFVRTYLADDELHSVFDQNAMWVRTRLELVIHILPLIWSHVDQFVNPLLLTTVLSFIGMAIMISVLASNKLYY